jgi:hypothetical protein
MKGFANPPQYNLSRNLSNNSKIGEEGETRQVNKNDYIKISSNENVRQGLLTDRSVNYRFEEQPNLNSTR